MTKKEILVVERDNFDKVYLYLEGSFWKAYERSAFHFVKVVRPYKVVKKSVKSVGEEVVSLGFPSSTLTGIKQSVSLELIKETESELVFKIATALPDEDFVHWKSAIALTLPEIAKEAIPKVVASGVQGSL